MQAHHTRASKGQYSLPAIPWSTSPTAVIQTCACCTLGSLALNKICLDKHCQLIDYACYLENKCTSKNDQVVLALVWWQRVYKGGKDELRKENVNLKMVHQWRPLSQSPPRFGPYTQPPPLPSRPPSLWPLLHTRPSPVPEKHKAPSLFHMQHSVQTSWQHSNPSSSSCQASLPWHPTTPASRWCNGPYWLQPLHLRGRFPSPWMLWLSVVKQPLYPAPPLSWGLVLA